MTVALQGAVPALQRGSAIPTLRRKSLKPIYAGDVADGLLAPSQLSAL
jgi:hypothetical protein